jgi:hypothetical protein
MSASQPVPLWLVSCLRATPQRRRTQAQGMGRMTISGSAALPPSPRLSNGRPRATGTSVCFSPHLLVAPYHSGDRRWHGAGRSHGHPPRQGAALFPDPAGARDLTKRRGSANPWGRTAFNRTDNILWQQQSSSREPIVGSASNLPVNTWLTDGAYLPGAATRTPQASSDAWRMTQGAYSASLQWM